MHDESCWLTLTYREEDLPENGTLVKSDLVMFMKKLRKKYGEGIRAMACGEYGDDTRRPHYHVCLFGHDFQDRYPWRKSKGGVLHRSDELETLWLKGQAEIGQLTFESAAYTARYVTKKITGPVAQEHYKGREPEFLTMPNRPGLGGKFIEKFFGDVYPKDFITIRGVKMKPPIYFDRYLEKIDPEMYERVKERRKRNRIDDSEYWKINRLSQMQEAVERKLKTRGTL